MATIASKLKLNSKSIKDKYSGVKEVEDGKTKSQVAAKCDIPKNTLSTWLKNKGKIFKSHEERKQLKTPAIEAGHLCKLGSSNV